MASSSTKDLSQVTSDQPSDASRIECEQNHHRSKTQSIKRRAELEAQQSENTSDITSESNSSMSVDGNTHKDRIESKRSSGAPVSVNHSNSTLKHNGEQKKRQGKKWSDEPSSGTESSLSSDSKGKKSSPNAELAEQLMNLKNAGSNDSDASPDSPPSYSEQISDNSQRLMAVARMKANGFLPPDKDKIARLHAKGNIDSSSEDSISSLSDQQQQRAHQEPRTNPPADISGCMKDHCNRGSTAPPATPHHGDFNRNSTADETKSDSNYGGSNASKIVTGSDLSSSGFGRDTKQSNTSGSGSDGGSGSAPGSSGGDSTPQDNLHTNKRVHDSSSQKRQRKKPRRKTAPKGDELEEALQPDSDASLTAPEGQLAKNPDFTDKEAIVAARREYNRRNAARARKRAKSQVDSLQDEARGLGNSVSELRKNNEKLLDKLKLLKEQNVEIVRNHQILKTNMEHAARVAAPQAAQQNEPPATAMTTSSQDTVEQLLMKVLSQSLSTNATPAPQQPADQLRQLLASFQQPAAPQRTPSPTNLDLLLALVASTSANNNSANQSNTPTNIGCNNNDNEDSVNAALMAALNNSLQQNGGMQQRSDQGFSWF